jgi:hypothetical protein
VALIPGHLRIPLIKKRIKFSMVQHVCNPSYSRGRGRRIMSLRPALVKVVARPYLKNRIKTKRLRMQLWGRALAQHV